MHKDMLADFLLKGTSLLKEEDPELERLLVQEHQRQLNTLTLVAASSIAHPSIFACLGSSIGNLTTEGYPARRFHGGCEVADEIERLAIERAKVAFGACYANVQPHSGTSANQIVIGSLLKPGERIMGLGLNSGGHLSHGSRASLTGQWFDVVEYHVNEESLLDYDEVWRLACQTRPKLIVAGASAYPRSIDFARFRAIADEVGAYLLADVSHIAGLVVAGEHQSPINEAHFTTTSTYKQLYGPRGGLILMGRDSEQLSSDGRSTLAERLQKATFPFFQGTPSLNVIAAKARALEMVVSPKFKLLTYHVVENARALAGELQARGYDVLTGGTDNHMVILNIASNGLTGIIAERALEECGIVVNKNRIPGDTRSALITSGLRLGTNSVAMRGMGVKEMRMCAELVDRVLSSISVRNERQYILPEDVKLEVREKVEELCSSFAIPGYEE
ncbi:serine hydroxymethyltransferase [Ktedonobacter robiniae]|uniref:Probable serine hydroxymethyltransferase n=1 Tax=Ktedonobacter robiniae TaxID=2778365 RepID=A0ABQ3UW78_9CHLR|nr:serine hydroxymethyltransferase [Ktedonobacter robiniae]GHO56590.1 serine hydroxymethyltransferase [Ktedonobacter robiniae]